MNLLDFDHGVGSFVLSMLLGSSWGRRAKMEGRLASWRAPLCVSIALTFFLVNFFSTAGAQEVPFRPDSPANLAVFLRLAHDCPQILDRGGADTDFHMTLPQLVRECMRTHDAGLAATVHLDLLCPKASAALPMYVHMPMAEEKAKEMWREECLREF